MRVVKASSPSQRNVGSSLQQMTIYEQLETGFKASTKFPQELMGESAMIYKWYPRSEALNNLLKREEWRLLARSIHLIKRLLSWDRTTDLALAFRAKFRPRSWENRGQNAAFDNGPGKKSKWNQNLKISGLARTILIIVTEPDLTVYVISYHPKQAVFGYLENA